MNPLDAVARYGSRNKAADALGMGRTKFSTEYKLALQQNGANCHQTVGTDFNLRPIDYTKPSETIIVKPRFSIRADMPPTRVLAIGDTHDSPKLPDKARFRWIARHAAKTRPDRIVQIGDFGDFASCSMHEPAGSLGYANKPTFRQDIESLEEALTAIWKEVGSDIPLDVVEGNHEHRVQRWEESNPAVEGGFYAQLQDLWATGYSSTGLDSPMSRKTSWGAPMGAKRARTPSPTMHCSLWCLVIHTDQASSGRRKSALLNLSKS